ncbi:hypothetical protein [Streptomyces sp. NPDC048341]
MPAVKLAKATFTRPDQVRDVIHDFGAGGFASPSARDSARPRG